MSDRETLAVYDAQAADYAALTESEARDKQLAAFIADMPQAGHVLDLGCGPGHSAAEMARHGLNVTATDASAEMVSLAAAHPGVTAHQATFDEIAGHALYDGIWANFSLLHAPRDAMPRHLAAIVRALKPGGRFHIGVKTGTGSRRDALGRLYTYYTEDELTALLADAGLSVFATNRGTSKGLDGAMAGWITLAARA
ncbi:class I SAM-dependent methyltransferase [Shimia sp. FJ5]|uniref:class I SAM-dependent methyltransferase n=1 Tax=Shimia sp. FJ5 TaxID=3079054 RepID=UPI0026160464|nr:class I SAM-dependent methyltransferase [Shimia sp. FJ5]MDV4146216.1 class I SAM-dependent methyltransferase [Shimia sp. FJ5]